MLYVKPFSQIVDDVMLEMRDNSTETSVRNKYKRRVNDVYVRDVPSRFEWDWLHKTGQITLQASYDTGTVSVVQGSASVVGTGTVWTSAMSGMKFTVPSDNEIYTFTYTGATTGTLDKVYLGSTNTAADYLIFQDTYTLASDYNKPTNEPGFFYDYSQGRPKLKWKEDEWFMKHYTTVTAEFPLNWREFPDKTSTGLYQVQIMPPVDTARLVSYEYIRAQAEMQEVLGTAAAGCTATKILTSTNLYGLISVGQYLRVDVNAQWVKVLAIDPDTTILNGITVDTLIIPATLGQTITICDVPGMPFQLQEALFYGACYLTATEQESKSATSWLQAYLRAIDLDMSRRNRKRFGRQYMKLGGVK